MPDAPATRPSLLLRLRDLQDQQAWAQFVDVYAPLIYGYARKRGLQDADAADLTQACLRQVALGVGSLEYDPRRGTFRGWLFTIVRNRLRDFLRQHPRVIADVNALAPSAISGLHERKHDLVVTRFMLEQHRFLPGEQPLATDFNVELLFDDPLVVMTSAR